MSIRLTYVVNDLASVGGIQVFAKTTAKSLSNSYNIELVSWNSPLSLPKKGLIYLSPPPISKKIYPMLFKSDPCKLIQKRDSRLVHFWHVKAAMSVVNNIKIPYILTCHGSEIMRPRIMGYQFKTFLNALNKAAVITADSGYTKNYLTKYYKVPEQKVTIIYPGINLSKFQVHERHLEQIQHIGTLTRIGGRKNVLKVIEALEILKNQGFKFSFHLAGTGSKPAVAEVIAKLKKVHFQWEYAGKISDNKKITKFYPSLDVFVLVPTESSDDVEGFGIVFLEANASGVPVVASKTGGIPDAVSDQISGIFADPNSAEDIASKIAILLNSKINYRLSTRLWAKNFSQEKTAAQFQAIYETVLKRNF